MKKIYLVFSFLFVTAISNVWSQAPACNFDMTFLATGRDGIWPDSATNFVSGNVGTPYVQNITVKIPYDTTALVFGTVQTVNFLRIDLQRNITTPANYGLPPGLNIAVGPNVPSNSTNTTYRFPGNDTSCMVIWGTPTTAGTYTVSFTLKTFVTQFPLTSVSTDVVDYYRIVIDSPIGLNETPNSKFEFLNSFPNPANSTATIRFNSPKSTIAKLSVFNTLGKAVITKSIDTKQGENDFNLSVKDLSSGIYIYSLELEGKTITKKLIVSKD